VQGQEQDSEAEVRARALEEQLQGLRRGLLRPRRAQEEPVQGLRYGALRPRALEEQLQGLRHGPLRPRAQEEPVQGLRHGHRQARALISVIKCRLFFYSESITAGCLRRTAPTRPDDPNRQASSSLAQRTPARSTGGDRPSGTDMNRVMPLAAARTTGCYRKSVPGSH
jgi:hypothetical protein